MPCFIDWYAFQACILSHFAYKEKQKHSAEVQPRCSRGADQVQATTQLATTLYPQTPFSQVKNPTLRIWELTEDTEQEEEAQAARERAEHMRHGAGPPYPRNPEAMSRAADFSINNVFCSKTEHF